MLRGSRQLDTDLLRGSWRRRQQVREKVMRKLTTSRGSYEDGPSGIWPLSSVVKVFDLNTSRKSSSKQVLKILLEHTRRDRNWLGQGGVPRGQIQSLEFIADDFILHGSSGDSFSEA